jgi:phosphohistidine phosphatase SixA
MLNSTQAGVALSARHVACGGWSHVYTSDLHRTRQTTEAILKSAQEALEPDAETLPVYSIAKSQTTSRLSTSTMRTRRKFT